MLKSGLPGGQKTDSKSQEESNNSQEVWYPGAQESSDESALRTPAVQPPSPLLQSVTLLTVPTGSSQTFPEKRATRQIHMSETRPDPAVRNIKMEERERGVCWVCVGGGRFK